ncbi:hypothetical protein LCGC14_2375510 [marine sediment metagenome]|uniref:Uncharacterized protein n=1 Tax=marine sediment metagenome TaxID=412755 RepID=A0A0F9EEX1_9ZZZZ
MICTLREAMVAVEEGKKHWRDVLAGRVKPELPEKYTESSSVLRSMFIQGAVEEMDE